MVSEIETDMVNVKEYVIEPITVAVVIVSTQPVCLSPTHGGWVPKAGVAAKNTKAARNSAEIRMTGRSLVVAFLDPFMSYSPE